MTEEKKPTTKELERNQKFTEAGAPSRFQKGNQLAKGNGRPPMTAEQKAMALQTRTDFKNILTKYMTLSLDEMETLIEEEGRTLPVIDVAILRHYIKMQEHGDLERMDWSADHIMGAKPKQSEVIVTARKEVDLKKMSPEQLEQLEKIAEANEG